MTEKTKRRESIANLKMNRAYNFGKKRDVVTFTVKLSDLSIFDANKAKRLCI